MLLLPNTLVIGAMKAGTTSLWADLRRSSGVFVSANKEPGDLAHDRVLTADGLASYSKNFQGGDNAPVIVDFSTDLSKHPHLRGSAERCKRVLGEDLRIIYLTRNPVRRLESHHAHFARLGLMPVSLGDALEQTSELVDCSRYAFQLDAWTEVFSKDHFFISSLESYSTDRTSFLAELGAFLDVDVSDLQSMDQPHANSAAVGPRGKIGRSVVSNQFYRSTIAPLVPSAAKDLARSLLSKRARKLRIVGWDSLDAGRRAEIEGIFATDRDRMKGDWGHDVQRF